MTLPPYNDFLGTRLTRIEPGDAEMTLELGPHHRNKRGVAHGGVISSLLDSALGAAVVSSIPRDWWCATISLDTQFVAGATAGPLTARGRLVRRGRRVAFARGEVVDAQGRIVATASGSWHLWPYRPGEPRAEPGPRAVRLSTGGDPLPVGKIVAVGRNYAAHVAEMGAPPDGPPVLFFKPSTALALPGEPVALPTDAGEIHHEVELVAVIGSSGRAIDESRALDHVLGFAVGLDLTLREIQSRAKQAGEPWSIAKGFDGSAPVSDVAPRDEVGDGSGLRIRLEVDGTQRQEGNTAQMMRPVAALIAFASRWITLERGDLLFTGTPAGVGPIAPGQRAVAEIERVGRLEVDFRAEPPPAAP